jgi:2,4-didehydro-3-deoxy-L-rhamnonate hydrolase
VKIANLDGRLVIVDGDRAIDVAGASGGLFSADPQEIYERWSEFLAWAPSAPAENARGFDASLALAPVPRPRQVFAIGLNYREHAAEANEDVPSFPSTFTKFPTSLTGPYADVELPTGTVDWEVELVVVVGRAAFRVTEQDAWDHIAGFTIGQDLSERNLQLRPPLPQFSLAKSFPGFSPIGPFLATPDEFTDPDDLALECRIGDEVVQSARTSQMIFSVPALVERLSSVARLLPGDLIFTGTPAGVGAARDPRRYLRPGDVLTSSIEGLGVMRTSLVAAAVDSRHIVG